VPRHERAEVGDVMLPARVKHVTWCGREHDGSVAKDGTAASKSFAITASRLCATWHVLFMQL
jgi:hypothetical protein